MNTTLCLQQIWKVLKQFAKPCLWQSIRKNGCCAVHWFKDEFSMGIQCTLLYSIQYSAEFHSWVHCFLWMSSLIKFAKSWLLNFLSNWHNPSYKFLWIDCTEMFNDNYFSRISGQIDRKGSQNARKIIGLMPFKQYKQSTDA